MNAVEVTRGRSSVVHAAVAALVIACIGCVGGAPIVARDWGGMDGSADGAPIYIYGTDSVVDAEQFSVWTWPELEPVSYTTEVGSSSENINFVAFAPTQVLARWYVVRWQAGGERDARILGGVPLSDGSLVCASLEHQPRA